jgi:hypothetical protein
VQPTDGEGHPIEWLDLEGSPDEAGKKKKRKVRKRKVGKSQMFRRGIPIKVEEGDQLGK